MSNSPDTYGRAVQLGASRRRREDAEKLQEHGHYQGATYLGGYAIECSIKAAICDYEQKTNYKDTRLYQSGVSGATLHNLSILLRELPSLQRHIDNDRSGRYSRAWNKVVQIWIHDELRYSIHKGDADKCRDFMEAVATIHDLIVHTIIQERGRRRR